MDEQRPLVLYGSKAILAHLRDHGIGTSDRTLYDWIRTRGFPARRTARRVTALQHEVDEWVLQNHGLRSSER